MKEKQPLYEGFFDREQYVCIPYQGIICCGNCQHSEMDRNYGQCRECFPHAHLPKFQRRINE